MMPTISIIGCGWMGWPCARHLLAAGYSLKGSTTSQDKFSLIKKDGIQAFLLNLDKDEIPADLLQCDILFINFPPGRGAENLLSRYQKRINKVIAAAKKVGLQKIIFASSTGVYAASLTQSEVDENTVPAPVRTSAQAMWAAEQSLSAYTNNLTVLRFAGLVGGKRKTSGFLAGRKNLPNPNNAINLVHLDDCVAVVHNIIQQNIFGETFNVVADQHPRRQDYYQHQAKVAGFEAPQFSDQNTSPNKIVLNHKLKQKLAYTFIHPDPFLFP